MKKKLLAAVLAFALCGVFAAACGNKGNSNGGDGDDGNHGTVEHRHELSFVGEHSATCDEAGNRAYYICNGCGKWFFDGNGKNEIEDKDDVVLAAGHNLRLVERKESTCTADGNLAYYICLGCGKWYTNGSGDTEIVDKSEIVIAAGHTIRYVAAKNATCTEDGNTAYYRCLGCGKYYEDKDASVEIRDKSSVVKPKTPHEMTFFEAEEATCSKPGNVAYYSCSNCEKLFEDSEGEREISDKSRVKTKKAHQYEDKYCVVCGAHEPTEGILYYETDFGCTIIGIEETDETEIYIADEYNGKTVTAIGSNAFENRDKITAVSLPDGVNYIGGYAFKNCTALESIVIPEAVTSISGYAFENCTALESVTLSDGLLMISDCVFKDCLELTAIELPESLLYIGNRAFEGCVKLSSVDIPDSVKHLGEYAFSGCENLEEATIGSGISAVETGMFYGCASLTTVTIAGEVGEIGNYVFRDCTGLTTIIFKDSSEQWKAVKKGHKWDDGTGDYVIQCTDKNINKNESADE